MRDSFNLDGKVAIVTGAGRGLGEAIACGLAEYGADIVVAEVMSEEKTEVMRKIESFDQQSLFVHCNVGKLEDIERVVEETMKEFGRIDILVNNACTFRKTYYKLSN